MFVGYNLTTDNNFEEYQSLGNTILTNSKKEIADSLEKFIDSKGNIDGSKIQSNWFPQVEADIFISHSHKDEKKAIGLAGWLKKRFGLNSFIDSSVWGYSLDLLHEIDKNYCWIESQGLYDYNKTNYSASHVYMMLTTALTMMMDKTECVFFLNTLNSIRTKDIIEKTESPWIYHEIQMTKLIKQRDLSEHRKGLQKAVSESLYNKELTIQYDVDLSHLYKLDQPKLNLWDSKAINTLWLETHPLDYLYSNTLPKNKKSIGK